MVTGVLEGFALVLSSPSSGSFLFFFLIYFIELELICNVVLVSGVQQGNSLYIYKCYFSYSFHYSLL